MKHENTRTLRWKDHFIAQCGRGRARARARLCYEYSPQLLQSWIDL